MRNVRARRNASRDDRGPFPGARRRSTGARDRPLALSPAKLRDACRRRRACRADRFRARRTARTGAGSYRPVWALVRRRGAVCAADLPLLVLSLEGVTLPVCGPTQSRRSACGMRMYAMTPASNRRASSSKEPAASYSPRGSTPKYHRRGRA